MSNATRSRTFRSNHPELMAQRRRTYWLKRLYGITDEDFDAMLAAQDGRCAICRTDEPGGGHNRFHVDHCHETDVVRGLLCNNCNRGLGMFKDSRAHLASATAYLARALEISA